MKDAQTMREIAQSEDLPLKKSSLQKIFGSNLTLHAREARGMPQDQWFSLAAAKENHSESNLVSNLVRVYRAARTRRGRALRNWRVEFFWPCSLGKRTRAHNASHAA